MDRGGLHAWPRLEVFEYGLLHFVPPSVSSTPTASAPPPPPPSSITNHSSTGSSPASTSTPSTNQQSSSSGTTGSSSGKNSSSKPISTPSTLTPSGQSKEGGSVEGGGNNIPLSTSPSGSHTSSIGSTTSRPRPAGASSLSPPPEFDLGHLFQLARLLRAPVPPPAPAFSPKGEGPRQPTPPPPPLSVNDELSYTQWESAAATVLRLHPSLAALYFDFFINIVPGRSPTATIHQTRAELAALLSDSPESDMKALRAARSVSLSQFLLFLAVQSYVSSEHESHRTDWRGLDDAPPGSTSRGEATSSRDTLLSLHHKAGDQEAVSFLSWLKNHMHSLVCLISDDPHAPPSDPASADKTPPAAGSGQQNGKKPARKSAAAATPSSPSSSGSSSSASSSSGEGGPIPTVISKARARNIEFLLAGGPSRGAEYPSLVDAAPTTILEPGSSSDTRVSPPSPGALEPEGRVKMNIEAFARWLTDQVAQNPWAYPLAAPGRNSLAVEDHTKEPLDDRCLPVVPPVLLDGYTRKTIFRTVADVAGGSGTSGGRVRISNCRKCYIYILAPTNYVTISGCSNCTIVLGPTKGVVSLDHCEGVRLMSVNTRLRVLSSTDCSFFITTNTRPVLIGSNFGLTFAPFNTYYPQLEQHLLIAGVNPKLNYFDRPINMSTALYSTNDVERAPHAQHEYHAAPEHGSDAWVLLPPDSFFSFTVPVQMEGSTVANPCDLPEPYNNALSTRAARVMDVQSSLQEAQLNTDLKTNLEKIVETQFHDWLAKSGNLQQVKDLIHLASDASSSSTRASSHSHHE